MTVRRVGAPLRVGAMVLLGVACVLSSTLALRAQDASQDCNKCGAITEALLAAGIPIQSVRKMQGQPYEIIFRPDCTAAQRADAERIRDQILNQPANAPTACDNLQDALVILQFEPTNECARRIVRARYDQLKAQAH